MELVGVTLPSNVRDAPITQGNVQVIEDNAWPTLRAFYTNVRKVLQFAEQSFQLSGTRIIYYSAARHDSRANAKLALDAKRDELTRSFLMSRHLSTWSGACSSHIQTNLADPHAEAAYAEEEYEVEIDLDNEEEEEDEGSDDDENA
jgi:hypothetical protein